MLTLDEWEWQYVTNFTVNYILSDVKQNNIFAASDGIFQAPWNYIFSGVFFNSIENLHCLQPLRKLESIRLKDNTYNYTNPGNFFKLILFETI